MDWVRLLLAVVILVFTVRLSTFTGVRWMRLTGLREAIYCPEAFLRPKTRWLLYYLPILSLTVIAALLMPHWVAALTAVLLVTYSFKVGIRKAYLDSIKRQTAYYVEQGRGPDEAAALALRDVDATVELARAHVRTGSR